MFYDPNEPYREARLAITAQALAQCSQARCASESANARGDVVTCAGCTAQGRHERERKTCREFRQSGDCQRQVYFRITLARIALDLIRSGMSKQEVVSLLEMKNP